jgi:acid phosphatase family membrane protein YuiD
MAGGGIIMELCYLVTPFLAWLVSGTLKFIINSVKTKQFAFALIGYGGLPSNHSAIVSSMSALIAFKEGINHPAFGVSITLAFIVILDASSLRHQVGKHAITLNRLTGTTDLRERVGHTLVEIAAGVLAGLGVAITIWVAFC